MFAIEYSDVEESKNESITIVLFNEITRINFYNDYVQAFPTLTKTASDVLCEEFLSNPIMSQFLRY